MIRIVFQAASSLLVTRRHCDECPYTDTPASSGSATGGSHDEPKF